MSIGTFSARRPAARGFTLIELLVVMAVIVILASLALPTLIGAISKTEGTKCLAQMRQIGLGYINYLKDYDFWMPCAGSRGDVMFDNQLGTDTYKPTYELPWFRPSWAESAGFLYWFETFQPYLNPSATPAAAIAALQDPNNKDYEKNFNPSDPQPKLRVEQARLMGILSCPSKSGTPICYGYNYTAPFGNTYCYPNNRDKFKWYRNAGDSATDSNGSWTPIDYNGLNVPIPILWFEQYVHSSAISSPSTQIAWVDTGQTNSATMALTDSRRWIETPTNNDFGYVRFPLMSGYWPPTSAVAQYGAQNYAWRPIGRHGGKASCLNFDGSARSLPILDICSPKVQWGGPDCLFDNKPPTKPPISPLRTYDVTQQGGNL